MLIQFKKGINVFATPDESPDNNCCYIYFTKYFMNQIIKKGKLVVLNDFRFIPPQNVFAPPEENSDNDCFCLNEEGCHVPRGLFNMSACQFGYPIMMSWPHFLDVSLILG